jgi:hypothetical protein
MANSLPVLGLLARAHRQARLAACQDVHSKRGAHDVSMTQEDVSVWFATRGFSVRLSDTDYSDAVRASQWDHATSARDLHFWVDLLSSDGRLLHGGYGSGASASEAFERARERYIQEQGE